MVNEGGAGPAASVVIYYCGLTRNYTLSFRWTGSLPRSPNICNHRHAWKCTRKCLTALLWRHNYGHLVLSLHL